MSSKKIDYAKKGWNYFVTAGITFVIFVICILFFGNYSGELPSSNFFNYFFRGFYIAVFILSLISGYYFFIAALKDKRLYFLHFALLFLIIIYFARGVLETFSQYPFD